MLKNRYLHIAEELPDKIIEKMPKGEVFWNGSFIFSITLLFEFSLNHMRQNHCQKTFIHVPVNNKDPF